MYMVRHRNPLSQTRPAFLQSHVRQVVSGDFLVIPIIDFKPLFVLLVLARERRRVVHFNATQHPTADWMETQIAQAFLCDTAPRFVLRNRDGISSPTFRILAAGMQIAEVLAAPRSPWRAPYVERLIGSIQRECLDHIIVINESSLRRRAKGLRPESVYSEYASIPVSFPGV